jgi:hypothetical protein
LSRPGREADPSLSTERKQTPVSQEGADAFWVFRSSQRIQNECARKSDSVVSSDSEKKYGGIIYICRDVVNTLYIELLWTLCM